MRPIQNLTQLHALQNETLVYATIVAILIFAIAFVLSIITPWQGGHDRSYIKRRIWLVLSITIGSIGFFLYNDLYVMGFIRNLPLQNKFSQTNLHCLGITIGGSLLLSVIVMLIFRHSKFGSILGRERNN